ncbi:type IV secretory system conjugative DNA transfer family protein [Nocardioides lijunqiniae]|uniref:type IV secretory system conjugative DNA transfer family protein n=1 Tax=Nocardioides lijunqiniae TaxID=2760832 RepID=UPI0018782712|nr:TraM recognition domain-containing protein [Nocardioides lijunqiniae]
MPRRSDRSGGPSDEVLAVAALGGLAFVAVAGLWVSLHLSAALTGSPDAPAANPAGLIADVVAGRTSWTTGATVSAVALGVLAFLVVLFFAGRGGPRTDADPAARHMASRRHLRELTQAGAARTAKRLGVDEKRPGLPLGTSVRFKTALYSGWEYMVVVLAGPRTMKTTAYAIPAAMSAPGALLVTSNKRDLVEATRRSREAFGRVWVFDPQGVARSSPDAEPTWWWNPLTYIAPHDRTLGCAARDPYGKVLADPAKAEKLAAQLAMASKPEGSKSDAYFDPEAENLIGLLLLAAAAGEVPITTVYEWATDPTRPDPMRLLEEHGYVQQEQSLRALSLLADKQRDGVYGTARARLGFLRNQRYCQWITAPADPWTPQFHPAEFAGSTDTLYPLSKEGQGSAGPLVAALTMAVIDALEERATDSPGGRLPVPFVGVLDEAANICRFRDLDSLYSHFGSRGIVLMTILQNWAQGEVVWGEKGMEKLWSAANVRVYGGGVDDDRFLGRLSKLVGTYEHQTRSRTSGGRGGPSRTHSVQEQPILSPADLRELNGRAVVFASGAPAVLIKPQPWFAGPHAAAINANLAVSAADRSVR